MKRLKLPEVIKTDSFRATTFRTTDKNEIDTVFTVLTDLDRSSGYLIITCGRESWHCFFYGMRERTVAEYIQASGADYLEKQLASPRMSARAKKHLKRAIHLLKTEVIPLCP